MPRVLGQVLRNHKDTLISVLETCVQDPFTDWTTGKQPGGGRADDGENPQARDAMVTIEGA